MITTTTADPDLTLLKNTFCIGFPCKLSDKKKGRGPCRPCGSWKLLTIPVSKEQCFLVLIQQVLNVYYYTHTFILKITFPTGWCESNKTLMQKFLTRPHENIFVRKFFVIFPDVIVHAQKYFMYIKVIFSLAKISAF